MRDEARRGQRRTQHICNSALNAFIANHFSEKVARAGRYKEKAGIEREEEVERASDMARAAHGLKRTRHVFVTYYIFIATNEALNARTGKEEGRKKRRRRERRRSRKR